MPGDAGPRARGMAQQRGLVAKVLVLNSLGSHMGTGSSPGSSTSHPVPCLWPGKAVEDSLMLWDPAPMWETWKKFLDPGFGLACIALAVALTWGLAGRTAAAERGNKY